MNNIKQNKLFYYLKGYLNFLLPAGKNYQQKITSIERKLSAEQLKHVEERVNYYCKTNIKPDPSESRIQDLKKAKTPKSYYFDTYEYAKYFDGNLYINFVFGDVTEIPKLPSIVKSRPISDDNQNSILLNLDKRRHFVFVNDSKNFLQKKNILIGRGAVYQTHRYDFYEKYFGHPITDLGQVNKIGAKPEVWYKPKISLSAHLDYKFILCLQGNDVATNLKWVMSSNSIAVMPKPTLETWFMEGKLIGGKHYIEIKSDYSDLEEQLNFYINHPEKCLEIIKNANNHCRQFFNKDVEDLCSLKVLEKYLGLNNFN
ncbi:glycosyl transferase family 90 [Kaistella sp.]|uniref:glycosyl transferase family 90 n=1 Tax=Kaistella sp. TaxID=2782235 RepID=UPI002F9238AA